MLQSVFCKKSVATEMRQIVCIRAGKATKNKANNKVLIDKREGLLTLYVADSRTVHVRWNHVYGWNHRYCWNAVEGCAVEDVSFTSYKLVQHYQFACAARSLLLPGHRSPFINKLNDRPALPLPYVVVI